MPFRRSDKCWKSGSFRALFAFNATHQNVTDFCIKNLEWCGYTMGEEWGCIQSFRYNARMWQKGGRTHGRTNGIVIAPTAIAAVRRALTKGKNPLCSMFQAALLFGIYICNFLLHTHGGFSDCCGSWSGKRTSLQSAVVCSDWPVSRRPSHWR